MEPPIDADGANEFIVAARFEDAAAVEDCDLAGAANGLKAMGDDVDGAPFGEDWKAPLERAIRFWPPDEEWLLCG